MYKTVYKMYKKSMFDDFKDDIVLKEIFSSKRNCKKY